MLKIAIVNSKGGTGKSTTALLLWQHLNARGRKSLLIDLDPQTNLTQLLGASESKYNIYDILAETAQPNDAINKTQLGDIIGGSKQTANPELLAPANAFLLKDAADKINGYEFIIFDTPPTPPDISGIINNALICADGVIIVTDPENYGLQGTKDELNIISKIKTRLNPKLQTYGILINNVKTNPQHQLLINRISDMATAHGAKVFNQTIRNSITISRINAADDLPAEFKRQRHTKALKDFALFVDELTEEL